MDLEMLRISTREDGERVLDKTLPGNKKSAFTFVEKVGREQATQD
jgi:hypothetical protein